MVAVNGKIIVTIDADLEEIVPGYLENRWKDVDAIGVALPQGDFDTLRVLGHRMKGSGAGYGFDEITEIGRKIELAAKDRDDAAIRDELEALKDYLERVAVVYE